MAYRPVKKTYRSSEIKVGEKPIDRSNNWGDWAVLSDKRKLSIRHTWEKQSAEKSTCLGERVNFATSEAPGFLVNRNTGLEITPKSTN